MMTNSRNLLAVALLLSAATVADDVATVAAVQDDVSERQPKLTVVPLYPENGPPVGRIAPPVSTHRGSVEGCPS